MPGGREAFRPFLSPRRREKGFAQRTGPALSGFFAFSMISSVKLKKGKLPLFNRLVRSPPVRGAHVRGTMKSDRPAASGGCGDIRR